MTTPLNSSPIMAPLSCATALAISALCAALALPAQGQPADAKAPQQPATSSSSAFKGWSTRESTTAPAPREMTDVEKTLVERATARQQFLAKGEYKAAYEFLSPSSKAFKPYAAFEAEASGSSLRETKATRAECDKDGRCSVTLVAKAGLQQPRIGMLSVPVMTQEVWVIQSSGEALLILR